MTTMTVTPKHLAEIALFAGLSPDELTELAERGHIIELHAGDVLFEQGDLSDKLYLVESGQMHVTRHYNNGDNVILQTLSPYETIGEVSTIANEARVVSAAAVSDCTLVALDREALMNAIQAHPAIAETLMQGLAKRLHREHLLLREYAVENPTVRLANLILLITRHQTGLVTKNVHKRRMARTIGVDLNWLNQMLNSWVEKGILENTDDALMLKDVHGLEEVLNW